MRPARLTSAARIVAALAGDPRRHVRAVRGVAPYIRNLRDYRARQQDAPPSLRLGAHVYPCLTDRYELAGTASGHYFHQDIWAARRIFEAAPARHVDVGSRVDGFVAHLLCFREVEVVDLRPLVSSDPRLRFVQASMLSLPYSDGAVESISCLHAAEHVGLGRYGDAVDPLGCFAAMRELKRVVAAGGRLYFSVPIGRERVEFDAHRVFAPRTILEVFDDLELAAFGAVDDRGDLAEEAEPEQFADSHYACGLFLFEKR